MVARRLVVRGRVQGVFYRNWTVSCAREIGVAGWVRNCPDGTVEAVLEGDAAKVTAMTARMHEGPAAARVNGIDVAEIEAEGIATFTRR